MTDTSVIQTFYNAFKNKNAEIMGECYHQDATFSDPVFGKLNAVEARAMWQMLIERGGDKLQIDFEVLGNNEVKWTAHYRFGKRQRMVKNVIMATFILKDHKILLHKDEFDFYRWSKMALGPMGYCFGWTDWMKQKVSARAKRSLEIYLMKHHE